MKSHLGTQFSSWNSICCWGAREHTDICLVLHVIFPHFRFGVFSPISGYSSKLVEISPFPILDSAAKFRFSTIMIKCLCNLNFPNTFFFTGCYLSRQENLKSRDVIMTCFIDDSMKKEKGQEEMQIVLLFMTASTQF